MENENQSFSTSVIARMDEACFVSTDTKTITRRKNTSEESVVGYNFVETADIIPHFFDMKQPHDKAKSWKWEIRNTGTNGFYLNQMQAVYSVTDADFVHTSF